MYVTSISTILCMYGGYSCFLFLFYSCVCIQYMLQCMYDVFVFVVVQNKWTALMRASNAGHTAVVALLLHHGANVTVKDTVRNV